MARVQLYRVQPGANATSSLRSVFDSVTTGSAIQITSTESLVDFAFRSDPESRPLDELRHRILLGQAISDVGKDWQYFGRIADTRGFADRAAGTIAELKEAGYSRRIPKADARLTDVSRLFAAFEKRRLATERNGPEDQILRAAPIWKKGKPSAFAELRVVVLDGFTTFTEPQKRLIEAVVTRLDVLAVSLSNDGDPAVAGWLRSLGPSEDYPVIRIHDAPIAELIEAPGPVGEARLVARRIRELLATGTLPNDIVVTARDIKVSADVLSEVFDEYAIPVQGIPPAPLCRAPAIAFLLQAWRLPTNGFVFTDVAAMLRSSFYRPQGHDPDITMKAEALLRKIGGPDGKEAFVRAVDRWAESPPLPLEDETAETGTRKRTHTLAKTCQPFLKSFFALWDNIPTRAKPEAWIERFRQFARECGVEPTTHLDDQSALQILWEGLSAWIETLPPAKAVPAAAFALALASVTSTITAPVTLPAGNAVRILSAEDARFATCDYLFLTGLGEGSFPHLAPPESLLTEADRGVLRGVRLSIPDPASRRQAEQSLFNDLIARPRKGLVLSYAAVDAKGQEQLPSSFLADWREQNPSVAVTKQKMLIQNYAAEEAYSDAERRVRFANSFVKGKSANHITGLPKPVVENLKRAYQIAQARLDEKTFNRFDGGLLSEFLNANLELLGRGHVLESDHVFSPTALETYVACPFRFWLEQVLGIEPLDDPPNEVEQTRRGSAVHRAMARYHASGPTADNADAIAAGVRSQLDKAVEEYRTRSGSPVTAALWELEGLRLHRTASRYPDQWQSFREKEAKNGPTPKPQLFEAAFGLTHTQDRPSQPPLVLTIDNVEVRIGGTVDRIDAAELPDGLGFWIIDYKSGRGTYYPATAVARLEALQLPLYALAAERVLFPGKPARPLGLAYWLVTDAGPKSVLPKKVAWDRFRDQLELWVVSLVTHIRKGAFPLAPRSKTCTATCPHGPVCRIAQHRNTGKRFDLYPPPAEVPDEAV